MRVKFLFIIMSFFFCVAAGAQVNDTLIENLHRYDLEKAARGDKTISLNDTVKVNLLSKIALRDYDEKPEETLQYLEEQEKLSEQIKYTRGLAGAYEMKGNIYEYQRKYARALYYFKKALALYIIQNDIRSIDVTNNTAIVYSKQGIYTEALKYHLNALKLSKKFNDAYGYVSSYNNIGILYTSLKKYDLALKYYFNCLKIQISKKEGFFISNTYQNIGELYRIKKHYGKAITFLQKGVEAAIKEEEPLSLANCYSTISAVYSDQKQYERALEYAEKGYAIRQKSGDGFGLFTSYSSFVNIYNETGRKEEALYFATKALEHLEGHDELDMHKEAYRQLADVNAALGNYGAAYQNHVLYKKYNDSIFNAENLKKLTEQQMNFDFSNKELLAKQALQRQKYIRNYTIGGLGAAALFFIIFLVRRYRKKITQKKHEYEKGLHILQDELDVKETEAQSLKSQSEIIQLRNDIIAAENERLQERFDYNNRELASITLNAFQKNKMLAALKTEVEAFEENKVTAPQIEKIKAIINHNLHHDADWEKFKLHFEQVHPDFFKELEKEHPGLTTYETRLYTYLDMKLSTKEIAGLLNITPASVIKAKVRLNKKLNRNGDDSVGDKG
jgi:tetratricopeptide (TPR) repeat protein